MKKLLSWLLLAVVFFFFSGCATLFHGTSEEVHFGSNPVGAEVWISGVKMGETPFALKLEVKKTYVVEFRKEGYKTVAQNITNHVGAGWIILDVICGLVPVIVDAATGAWYSLDQKNVDAALIRQQPYPIPLY